MALKMKRATRELIWVKLALMAPSGGGKTYSALRLATGMLEQLKKQTEEGAVGCVVPLHPELKIGTLKGILRQARITVKEFMENL